MIKVINFYYLNIQKLYETGAQQIISKINNNFYKLVIEILIL